MADFYQTIEAQTRAEIKEKKSKFIATAIPASSVEEAKEQLDKIRLEFHDSRHNCYAYRIGAGGLVFRSADDGEPSGTAGKPILFAIKKYDYSDVLLVVTRYFGGVKLGRGPLARAYGDVAEEALKLCKAKVVDITKRVKVFCTYEEINIVKRLLNQYAKSYDETYTDNIDITASIPSSQVQAFVMDVDSKTYARAGTQILD